MRTVALLLVVIALGSIACEHQADPTTNATDSSTNQQAVPDPPRVVTPPERSEPRQPSARFSARKKFVSRIKNADDIRLFEGLPHPMFERDILEREMQTKPAFDLHGYLFYEERLALEEPEKTELSRIFQDPRTFVPWTGPKACGGFHPDFCVEWQVGQDVYHALLCFGCGEAKFFGPDVELYCDMNERAPKRMGAARALRYKNRPEPKY
jgi:hypothetical protein